MDGSGAAPAYRLGFTGREFDPETGLWQYRKRYYDAAAGAFLSPDPRGMDSGDWNLYRYVGNGPTYATDPSGEITIPEKLVSGAIVSVLTSFIGAMLVRGYEAYYDAYNGKELRDTYTDLAINVAYDVAVDSAIELGTAGFGKIYKAYQITRMGRFTSFLAQGVAATGRRATVAAVSATANAVVALNPVPIASVFDWVTQAGRTVPVVYIARFGRWVKSFPIPLKRHASAELFDQALPRIDDAVAYGSSLFNNTTNLRNRMVDSVPELAHLDLSGTAPHHIIPREMAKTPLQGGSEVIEFLRYDLDEGLNGILMFHGKPNGPSPHTLHPGYNQAIRDTLKRVWDKAIELEMTDAQKVEYFSRAVRLIQTEAVTYLESGVVIASKQADRESAEAGTQIVLQQWLAIFEDVEYAAL